MAERTTSQPDHHGRATPRVVALTCAALVTVPFLVASASLVGERWFPSSDWAFELLSVRRVGTGHTPLVGVVSRFGWYHPGPWIFYALAPFERLGGATAALVGAGLIGGAWCALAVLLFARRAPTGATVLLAVLLLVLAHAFGPDTLVDPWNPWMAFWPFMAAVVALWLLAERDVVAIPSLAAAGTLAIQAHVSYAPLLLGLGVVAVIVALFGHGRGAPAADRALAAAPVRRSLLVGAVLGAVLWLPPLLQQLTGHPGNLGELARYFGSSGKPTAGWHLAWLTTGAELRLPGPWLTGHDAGPIGYVDLRSMQQGIVLVGLTALLGVLAWRQGHRQAGRFAALAVLAVPVTVAAISRITGIIATYLVRWTWAIAGLLWLSLLWSAGSLARSLLHRLPGDRRLTTFAAGGVIAAIAIGVSVDGGGARVPKPGASEVVRTLAEGTARALPHDTTYLLTGRDSFTFGGVMSGVGVELMSRGFRLRVPAASGDSFGSWLVARPGAALPVLVVVSSVDGLTDASAPLGGRELVRADPLSGAQRLEERALEARVAAAVGSPTARVRVLAATPYGQSLLRTHGAAAADVGRLAWFIGQGAAYGVYIVGA